MTFQIHTTKFIISMACTVIFGACAVESGFLGIPCFVVIFACLCFIYLYVGLFVVGACVTIDEHGVRMHTLGITLRRYTWQDIEEVGVAGVKVFNKRDQKKTGSIYIYLSNKRLDDKQRFKMCLEWPPKKCIYLGYSTDRFTCVQSKWKHKVETFNIGSLVLY